MNRRAASAWILCAFASACQRAPGGLVQAPSGVTVTPQRVDFGAVYLGAEATRTLSLANVGPGAEAVTLALEGPSFSTTRIGSAIGPGTTLDVPVRFAPTAPGLVQGTLRVAWPGGVREVSVSGEGLGWPACPLPEACQSSAFDPQSGTCRVDPSAEGAACASADPCLLNTVCTQGQCLGQFAACDDGDPCTQDACAPGQGCIHVHDPALCPTPGACVDPTLQPHTPGDVLWTYAPDSGAEAWRQLQAVDDAGNSYVIDLDAQAVTSLDPCGNERWTQPLVAGPRGAMLSGDKLLLQEGGLLESRVAATGELLWQVDVAQLFGFCDGGSCGATLEGDIYAGPAVLSGQGQIFLTGSTPGPPWYLQVASIGLDGTVQWVRLQGELSATVGGANQVADAEGNLYFYLLGATGSLQAIDPQGQMLFSTPAYAESNLAVGPGFVLDLGGNPPTAWSPRGQSMFSLSPLSALLPEASSSGVVDVDGSVIFWPGASSTSTPGFRRFDSRGAPVANVVIQGIALSELTLDEAGRTYVLGIAFDVPQTFTLWCWDGDSSTLSLARPLGSSLGQPLWNGLNLFVTHGMALTTVGSAVTAIYVGPHGASSAPWSRGFGGNNANQRRPQP